MYPGLPMFFSIPDFWYGTLKNMGRPGKEAIECILKSGIYIVYIEGGEHRDSHP